MARSRSGKSAPPSALEGISVTRRAAVAALALLALGGCGSDAEGVSEQMARFIQAR